MSKDQAVNPSNAIRNQEENRIQDLKSPGITSLDAEVIAVATRRKFSGSEKKRILEAAANCTQPGEIGALLRREGIYSSMLHKWRHQQKVALRQALAPQKRGVKTDPALAEARKMKQLTQENARLTHKLAQAQTIIDVQKKLCSLFGLPNHDALNDASS